MIQITSSICPVVPVIVSEVIQRGSHLGDSKTPLCSATETELIQSKKPHFFPQVISFSLWFGFIKVSGTVA